MVVRCRPMNSKETNDGRARIVEMDKRTGQVILKNPKADGSEPPKTFTFDAVYDWNCSQQEIYVETAKPIVNSVMEGYNGELSSCMSMLCVLWTNLGVCSVRKVHVGAGGAHACKGHHASKGVPRPRCMVWKPPFATSMMRSCRHHLCLWPDGYWQDAHHGWRQHTRAARYHPSYL